MLTVLSQELKKAIDNALESKNKPTLICCKTKIGFGSQTKEGKEVHMITFRR